LHSPLFSLKIDKVSSGLSDGRLELGGRPMVRLHLVALSMAVSLNASLSVASPQEAIRYDLASESWFGEICELCDCPDFIADLSGTFLLLRTGEKDGFRTFDVLEVEWKTSFRSERVAVTGSGTFRQGGPSGRQQLLELDLRVGDEEMHFTSGPVEAELDFPRLAIRVETNLEPTCRDTVLFLIARPEPPDLLRGD
jgi:hypothetical protein